MRFIDFTPGGPENMKLSEGPKPTLKEGEVLIAVKVAGVNRPDLMQRQGKYPPPPNASHILGLEVSGTIVDAGTSKLKVGDEVCALTPGGGYAEFVAVPAEQVLSKPRGLSWEEAAGVPENYFTVWANVFRNVGLKAGETFLVHGGTSGIGTTAIQLAHALGSTAYATAGTDAKCKACVDLGAKAAINYKTHDFEAEMKTLVEKGVDVILDMVGGPYTQKNINILARKGRLTQIATQQGMKVEIDLMKIMQKLLIVTGSTLRPLPLPEKALIAQDLRERVWPLLEARKVHVVIDRVFDFEKAAEAHAYLEKGDHIGKVLLKL